MGSGPRSARTAPKPSRVRSAAESSSTSISAVEHLLQAAHVRVPVLLVRVEEGTRPLQTRRGVDDLLAMDGAAPALHLVLRVQRERRGRLLGRHGLIVRADAGLPQDLTESRGNARRRRGAGRLHELLMPTRPLFRLGRWGGNFSGRRSSSPRRRSRWTGSERRRGHALRARGDRAHSPRVADRRVDRARGGAHGARHRRLPQRELRQCARADHRALRHQRKSARSSCSDRSPAAWSRTSCSSRGHA